jgi:hypothetical protein
MEKNTRDTIPGSKNSRIQGLSNESTPVQIEQELTDLPHEVR